MADNEVTLDRREELLAKARDLAGKATDEERELNDEEQGELSAWLLEVKSINERMVADTKSKLLLAKLDSMAKTPDQPLVHNGDAPARSIGEHFLKHAHQKLIDTKGQNGVSIAVPDYNVKAATDVHQVTGWTAGVPFLTDYDRTIVHALRIRLTVADLLGAGSVSGNAISYLVEGALAGNYTTVAEGAAKPQMNFATPTAVVDAVKKIAGWIQLTDEFIEDAEFLVTEINNRLLYQLGYFEEQQLLNGPGTGTTILGLLARSGIQTETGATKVDNPDAVFRAMTKVEVNSGLPADGIVVHPTDYQAFRLAKDANNQYFGGGFFSGEYGNGGIVTQPPLWGLKTVVTPAIAAGTVLVGAFKLATTLYRKGGVRVESTNSNASDFVSNLITIRAEERVALAVRVPLGLCKLTLGTT